MGGLKFGERPEIDVAESVRGVVYLTNPYAAAIMDCELSINEEFVDAILAQSILSWNGREPAPALDKHGNFRGTDLDMLSMLVPLAERGAVIEIPNYRARRPAQRRSNVFHIGDRRFGPLTGLTSNQKFFSFSARITDNSVVTRDLATNREQTGAPRNFMVVGPEGKWHEGWKSISFHPTAAENKFLSGNGLVVDNAVAFKYAVHPNRWQSIFGAPYLLLKMLFERLTQEWEYYNAIAKDLATKYATGEKGNGAAYSEPSGSQQAKRKVRCFEALIDLPRLEGAFPAIPHTQQGYEIARNRAHRIRYRLKPKVQLIIRADELAYFLHGLGKVARWMPGLAFEEDTPSGKRIVWQQMKIADDVAYRWRTLDRTETVTVGFDE